MTRTSVACLTATFTCFGMLCAGTPAHAQTPAAPSPGAAKPAPLDAPARKRVIDALLERLDRYYSYPEMAKRMIQSVREKEAAKAYDGIADGPALAARLTEDLRAICHDLHLSVQYSAEALPPDTGSALAPPPGYLEEMHKRLGRENYGVKKVEVLPGNVGYLRIDYFAPLALAADTYAAALNCLANTDALIVDVRSNGGSMDPDTLPVFCGYFFDKPVHLSDIYWRDTDSTRQFWTAAQVPGKKYLDKPVYVLTSGRSFSGAEGFAYDLKHLKRATIVGDTTGGGANPGGTRRLDEHFSVWLPSGRVTNAVTKTNWEGVGVPPDIAVPAGRALTAAHQDALKRLAAKATDPEWKSVLQSAAEDLDRQTSRVKRVSVSLQGYPEARLVMLAGTFNYWAPKAKPLTRKGDAWVAEVEVEPGRHGYKFVVDGKWVTDPANPATMTEGGHVNSLLVVE